MLQVFLRYFFRENIQGSNKIGSTIRTNLSILLENCWKSKESPLCDEHKTGFNILTAAYLSLGVKFKYPANDKLCTINVLDTVLL